MAVRDPKEVFLTLLSDVRQSTERSVKFHQEIIPHAQDPDVKQILESQSLIAEQDLTRLDRCFSLIGEKPVKLSGRLQEVFIEDFRKEVAEIQSPVAKRLFVLAKLSHLAHFRAGEYVALTAAADMTGNYAVGLLIESCLADKLAFAERARRLIRNIAEERIAERRAA
ncbi:MAG: ferritin-like domain-containing protein [Acidobacteriales bacterium]|nr:ferritin-like domain-containing protein [Terriglobales bacterium]